MIDYSKALKYAKWSVMDLERIVEMGYEYEAWRAGVMADLCRALRELFPDDRESKMRMCVSDLESGLTKIARMEKVSLKEAMILTEFGFKIRISDLEKEV